MVKEKAYYQAFLILEHLPKEEYKLIPKEILDEIENKMEYDETIAIDASKSLQSQKIDEQTYEILDNVMKAIEKNTKFKSSNVNNACEHRVSKEANDYVKQCMTDNKLMNTQMEVIHLNKMLQILKIENEKIADAKELILGYQNVVATQKEEIKKLKIQVEELERNNMELVWLFKRIPKFLRKVFIKVDFKFIED